MASPPRKRKNRNEYQSHATAQPSAVTTYNTASACSEALRPYLSLGAPATIDPSTVPHKAEDTVMPSMPGVSEKISASARVAPAITAVSKPKSSPPRAATMALLSR